MKTVDCRRAGLSAAETTVQLRHFCENWRQPFQKDYTQSSVTHAFEQLLALRADFRKKPQAQVGTEAGPKVSASTGTSESETKRFRVSR